MKSSDVKRIARAVCALVPHLQPKGRLLAATPRGRILRGIYLEDARDASRFYVWAFVQPLYAPALTIAFNLGKRLGGPSKSWSIEEVEAAALAVRDEGVPFFDPVASPESLAAWDYLEERSDPYALEAIAYSLGAAGRLEDGKKALRRLAALLTEEVAWKVELRRRAELLASLVETEPLEAEKLLCRWESETVSALRLQEIS